MPEQGNSQHRSARRPARLPPSRIYTINNTSQDSFAHNTAPKTAPIGPSSSPFRHSNHSTGNMSNNSTNSDNIIGRGRSVSTSNNGTSSSPGSKHNIIGRSRSFSTGGVVPRSRADSEASRLALEALIQKRLDRITQRLDDFNFQSHELHTRTQALAKSFQDNAKRLYKVEDHLLRVQGKPGLSDAYIENAGPMQPRRLTHDLEELRMGVKTLRKKFQVAGSVVSTVDWWKRLKDGGGGEQENNGANTGHAVVDDQTSLDDVVVSSPSASSSVSASPASIVVSSSAGSKSSSSSSSFSRTVSRKEGQALQKIMTAPDATATVYTSPVSMTQDTLSSPEPLSLPHGAVAAPAQGLRSPPLTPKGPPSLLSAYLAQRIPHDDYGHTTNIKARPLSVIQDLEEPLPRPLSLPTTAWSKDDNDNDNNHDNNTAPTASSLPALSLADDIRLEKDGKADAFSSPAVQSSRQSNNNNEEEQSRPVFLEIFTPPSHAGTTTTPVIAADAKEDAVVVSQSSLTEPNPEADFSGVENNAGCEAEELQLHEEGLQEDNDTLAEHVSAIKEIDSFVEGVKDEELIARDSTSGLTPLREQQVADKTISDAVEESLNDDLLLPALPETRQAKDEPSAQEPPSTATTIVEEQQQDTWIQALWKILIRLEYLLLGTAVLGAMMPDSLLALCAGFLSAVLYGALVIRHRILASPESEAPKRPSSCSSYHHVVERAQIFLQCLEFHPQDSGLFRGVA
ncbi:hypothetical protein BGW39_011446 [Mortierella sp. 14UC]|nr:hypothetical protein BGW39_011446 [Mortierella sp. 14UC]